MNSCETLETLETLETYGVRVMGRYPDSTRTFIRDSGCAGPANVPSAYAFTKAWNSVASAGSPAVVTIEFRTLPVTSSQWADAASPVR